MKNKSKDKNSSKWIILVTCATFLSTIFFNYISDILLKDSSLLISIIVLLVIIFTGILMDIVGVAITAVGLTPFNSMASRRVRGAKIAVKLIKNAPRISNICNDVIGDICGILSGATGLAISTELAQYFSISNLTFVSLIMSGIIASLTVGGKALGKEIAISRPVPIILTVAKFLSIFRHENSSR